MYIPTSASSSASTANQKVLRKLPQEEETAYSSEDDSFDWILENNYKTDINSTGKILLNQSDLARQMSAEDRENWNNQAQEILDEQTPRIALGAETRTIEYEKNQKQHSTSSEAQS
jgi:hypothetical protein